MHLVVLCGWPAPVERAAATLAHLGGLTPYDARTRVSGDRPRIGAILADFDAAEALATGLQANGFVARVLSVAGDVEHDEDRDHAASMTFGDDAITFALRGGGARVIRWRDVELFVRGVRTCSSTVVEESTTRKFSAGRAILSGGLLLSKAKTTQTTRTEEAREGFLYVHEAGRGPSVAIYEHRVDYRFLGAALAPHAAANLATVARTLRERAPAARWDDRLLRPPALGAMPLPPGGVDPGAWRSDVAAAVIALAS